MTRPASSRPSGRSVTLFKPGDEVWYAGSIIRPGTNSEFHLVDERIVGSKPKSLDFAAAAALPLTSITAWEMLFDRFARRPRRRRGQIAADRRRRGRRRLDRDPARAHPDQTDRDRDRVTAGDEGWCQQLGAHHVIDHSKPMAEQLKAIGHRFVDYIFGVTQSDQHFDTIADVIAPQGKFGLIDDPKPFEFAKLKGKSASLHWEAMFTRSTFQTPDMDAQHKLLNEVARMVDAGTIRTTVRGELRQDQRREPAPRARADRERHARAARSCWKASRRRDYAVPPSGFPRWVVCMQSDR